MTIPRAKLAAYMTLVLCGMIPAVTLMLIINEPVTEAIALMFIAMLVVCAWTAGFSAHFLMRLLWAKRDRAKQDRAEVQ